MNCPLERGLLRAAGPTHHCETLVGISIDRELLQATVQTRLLQALVEAVAAHEPPKAARQTHPLEALVGAGARRRLLQGGRRRALVAQALATCKASVRRLSAPPSAAAADHCLACRAA